MFNGTLVGLLGRYYPSYDIPFGVGFDASTRRFLLQPNPGIAGSPGIARIVFYTPNAADGADSGPTNVTAFGSTFATYTRNSLAKCKALIRTVSSTQTSRPQGYGDWLLFQSGTITFPNAKGETFYGIMTGDCGASRQYPAVVGTYNVAAMTDPTGWNNPLFPCLLDFSAVGYAINSNGGSNQFFYNTGDFASNICFSNIQIKKTLSTCIVTLYGNFGACKGRFFQNITADGAAINMTSTANTLESNGGTVATLLSLTSVGTTATARILAPLTAAAGNMTGYITGTTLTVVSGTAPTFGYILNGGGVSANTHVISGGGGSFIVDVNQTTGSAGSPVVFTYTFSSLTTNIANAGGTLSINLSGDSSNKYNGTFVCSFNDATSFTYTFAGSSNAPATGTVNYGVVTALAPDTIAVCDAVFNQCGFGYYGGLNAAHPINVLTGSIIKRERFYNCVMVHGGWPRSGDRNTGLWPFGAGFPTNKFPITSLTRSGTTVTALAPNTSALAVGSGMCILNSNYFSFSVVTSITPNVSFTYEVDANGAPATMGGAVIQGHLAVNTLTVDILTSGAVAIGQQIVGPGVTTCTITGGSGTSWTYNGGSQTVGSGGSPITINCCPTFGETDISGYLMAKGAAPDVFAHGYYIENNTYDVKMYGCITAYDCVNSKLTGGPLYMEDCISIRNPISYIAQSFGNDSTGNSWPSSSTITDLNGISIFSDDLNSGAPRGNAGQMVQPGIGSYTANFLLINASNILGGGSVASRSGPATFANTGGYSVYQPLSPFSMGIYHGVISAWGVTDATDFSGSGTTKTFAYNVTSDDLSALPGTGNKLLSTTSAAFQTAVANTLLLDIANTFRVATPELAGVTVAPGTGTGQGLNNAANLQTEQNILDFMMYHPYIDWKSKLQSHLRQYLGR